ncbi:MAG TPA: AmmeMemoRadiSam system protein B [Gemmataceae bacterium]|nr:AmmeMemoRadiSam system protein B [Gemmataceae bacterium]
MSEPKFAVPERPQLRPGLAAGPDADDPRFLIIYDELRISSQMIRLPKTHFALVEKMNGRRSLRDLQAEAMRVAGGLIVPLDAFAELVERLDAALFLDSPRFEAYLTGPVRQPSCVGCYPAEPAKIRAMLRSYFTAPGGPGLPAEPDPNGRLRAALLPHIDYQRGNVSFAWGFKEVFEHSDASLFVIIGTSHYSPQRFTVTRQHFQTPLGLVETDQEYIDKLENYYGDGLFDDQIAHFPEHSIELEVVYLQYLYENRRPFKIVPLVVGSFRDCVEEGIEPSQQSDIQQMIQALRQAEAETKERICYIISGDLAHIGPKFGDHQQAAEPWLARSREQDQAILKAAGTVDMTKYFNVIAAEQDQRRICGLPPTYTLLEAIRPSSGQLLHYGQYVHPRGHESVSFASMAFYQ